MLWEIEIQPKGRDPERERVAEEYNLLNHSQDGDAWFTATAPASSSKATCRATGGAAGPRTARRSARRDRPARRLNAGSDAGRLATVLLKPGVMDPRRRASSTRPATSASPSIRCARFRRYFGPPLPTARRRRSLPQGAGQRRHRAGRRGPADARASDASARRIASSCVTVPLRDLDDAGLVKLSRDGPAVAQPGRDAGDPGSISATWAATRPTSSWKRSPRPGRSTARTRRSRARSTSTGRRIDNLLKETIFGATQEIRRRLGAGRLVRQRLRGQRRRRALRRPVSTSASRSRRTIIRRPSSPTAAPTPASAASSATRSAPAWAPSRSATPTSSASPRRTRRRKRCRRACCIRARS